MRFQAVLSVVLLAVTAAFAAPVPVPQVPGATTDDGTGGNAADWPLGGGGGGW
ncbi:hypothetical protein FRC14_003626 [Serendipita sp. 396]|nr:hypothetical protein FRC14_004951 [Serendipita sp. 396]KAG8780575.1 hypothetical protein FRC15_009484 [Serendipita sp. 397]KAG8796963.1 hypothetical protein FRC16_009341 [Serendipita sp. 398]KAG8810645.1 hypothetical protein FRC18_003952 [Serendipita sp. 400]KAG8819784.1 hypothetical protein FRC19_009526 [Serendipita sp. 401]KAG8838742.1 hypothetical protein FRB91_007432 [Serendipita sp. 411]